MIAVAAAMPQSYPSETSNAKPSYDDVRFNISLTMISMLKWSDNDLNFVSQAPKPYSFDWSVKDDESKNDYGHKESSDGKVVTGSYRVALPDGRTQIVTYKADENGYVADVKYEGEAKYPAPESYKPAPKY